MSEDTGDFTPKAKDLPIDQEVSKTVRHEWDLEVLTEEMIQAQELPESNKELATGVAELVRKETGSQLGEWNLRAPLTAAALATVVHELVQNLVKDAVLDEFGKASSAASLTLEFEPDDGRQVGRLRLQTEQERSVDASVKERILEGIAAAKSGDPLAAFSLVNEEGTLGGLGIFVLTGLTIRSGGDLSVSFPDNKPKFEISFDSEGKPQKTTGS